MCETMVLTLVLAVGGIAVLFCLPLNQQLFACGAMIIVCTVVFVCLLEMMLLRKMLVKHAEKLLDTLDDMIAEKEEISFPEYHDTLTVKIQDRMKQYHEIMIYTREENQKEKEMIQSMVSDIAHQVRTPAANLKMFAEILGRNNLSEERKKQFFTMMEAQTEKINFLMDAMTKMSRLETGLVSLHQKRQSLLDTLAEAMSEVMPKAMKKGITVTVSCPEETEQIRSFFIGEGEGLFRYMEPYTQWLQEYEEAISSGQCTMRIWGLDQDVFSMMEETDWILDGTWDPEQFAEGGYALAVGSDRSFKEQPNYSRGELVEVDGRTFKIMATVYLPDRMTQGGSYHMFVPEIVIPGTDFREMYPKTSIRKFYFNVKDQKEKDAEALLESYENRIGAPIAEESSYTLKQSFQKECVRSVFPELAAGVLLFFLGISGYINTQATMTLARTKEFAIFQSMGMSRRKIFQMILWECLCYVLISSVIAVTVGCLYSLTILKMSIRQELLSTGWVMTYRFTLFPLPILVLVGLITAVLLAVFCFCRSEKKSVVERIRQMEM